MNRLKYPYHVGSGHILSDHQSAELSSNITSRISLMEKMPVISATRRLPGNRVHWELAIT